MFELTRLPYATDALEPWLSQKTVQYHYEVLQAKYVQRLNQATRGTHLSEVPLSDLVMGLDPHHPDQSEIWNMAAQTWNHEFLWKSMKPDGGGRPRGALRQLLGNERQLRDAFRATAASVFGSGWVWLMAGQDGIPQFWAGDVADNPMRYGMLPLLVCDCWEHAYYLDYPANRSEYVDVFFDRLVNWDFASANWERSFG